MSATVLSMQAAGFLVFGYLLTTSGLISPQDAKVAKQWGLYLLTPLAILQSFSRAPAAQLNWTIAAAIATLLTFISLSISWIVAKGRHRAQRALLLGSSAGGDIEATVLPLLYLLAGPVAVQLAAVAGLIHTLAVAVGSYWLCGTSQAAYPKNYLHEDGGMYNGQWQGRHKQGLGTYQYPGGAKYKGEWRNNYKEGRGVYTFPKGGSYEGEWRAGNRAGLGIRTMRSGKVLAGHWEDGQLAVPMEEWQCAVAAESAHAAAQAASRVSVGQADMGTAVQQVLLTPTFLVTLAGIALSLLRLPLPPTTQRVTDVLALANPPLMLLTFGASLSFTPIPASQWQDVCSIAAARYAPGLLVLASALGISKLQAALPLSWLAAVGVAVLSSLTPVPHQVAGYVQHFNLSKALASSTRKFCTWVSSALLSCLMLTATILQHSSNTGLSEIPQVLAAIQTPLLVVAVAAAVLLMVSVPLAGKLANGQRRQDQQRGNVLQQTVARPSVSQPMALQSTMAGESDQQLGDARKMPDVASQPAAPRASSDTAASTVDAEPMLSALQRADDSSAAQPGTGETSSVAPHLPNFDATSAPEQEPPASDTSGDMNAPDTKHGGFFRDVSTDCVPQLKSYHRQRRRWLRGNMPHTREQSSNTSQQPFCRQVLTSVRLFV